MIKKYIFIAAILLFSLQSYSQTWLGVGNTLQRSSSPVTGGFLYRFSLGSPGFMYLYTKSQTDSLFALSPKLTGNNIFNGTTNTFNGTLALNGNFNMTGNADITGSLGATILTSGSSTTNNLHVGTGIGGAWIDFISTGAFPYPYNWRIGNNVGEANDPFYIKYRTNEIVKVDTLGTMFIDDLRDNSGKYYLKTGSVPDSTTIANTYVPKTGNTTISGNKTFTGETIFNTSTTLTDGVKNFKTQFGTVAGASGQPFFQADSGYYVFKPLGTHAPRFYLLPTGTLTGTTSKFEMFNTDYIADQTNYSAFNIITNNATNTINIGANRNGSATRLQTIIGGDYNGSVLQAASPKITFNTDNSLSLSGNNMTNEAVVRNNFRINGNDVGGWNQFGLGIGLSSTSFANPFDIVISNTGGTIGRIRNPTAGTGNYSRFIWESDIINQFLVTAQSSTFTSNGINRQSGVVLNSTGVGALNIGATNAAGTIGLYTGGSAAANERINIDASGNTILRVSAKTPLLTLTNLSAGTAGTDSLVVKNATTNVIGKIAATYYAPISNPTFTTGVTLNTSSTGTVTMAAVNSNAGVASDVRVTASNGTNSIGFIQRGVNFTSNPGVSYINVVSTGKMGVLMNGTEQYTFAPAGALGIGVTSPTAGVHLKAGTATASTAPLKFTSGTNLTTPEAGAIEFDGTRWYGTPTTTRQTFAYLTDTPTLSNYTASGTGAATTITIPHGLTGVSGTSKVIVQPLNAASAGVTYVTVDATNVSIVYTIAPALGTSNLNYTISIKP